jgi:hypothetical protein
MIFVHSLGTQPDHELSLQPYLIDLQPLVTVTGGFVFLGMFIAFRRIKLCGWWMGL